MLLSSLKLINFRQFYGDNEIRFSQDPSRNITLLHGENGVGKTTLLNSIIWCLFGETTPDFERPNELVSHEAVAEGVNSCRVELSFEYQDKNYMAQRALLGTGKTSFKVYLIENYNYRDVPNPEVFISSILPRAMASYFFFHGEGILSISAGRSGEAFRRAIRDILGFTFAEAALDDLRKVKLQYSKAAGALNNRNAALSKAASAKADAEAKVDAIEDEITKISASIRDEEEKLKLIDDQLARSGNADVQRLKKEIDVVNRRLADARRELTMCNVDRQALIGKYGWAVFGTELAGLGLDFIDQATMKGRIPSPYQETFVKDLLEAKECICGRELLEGLPEYSRVLSLLETANTALISQRFMKARGAADNMQGRAKEFLEEVERIEKQRKVLDDRVGTDMQKLADLEQHLEGIDEHEIKRLTSARAVAKSKRDEYLRQDGRLKSELEQWKGRAEQAARELRMQGGGDQALRRLQDAQDLIERMMKRCKERLDEFEESARLTIAAKVNNILSNFSRKDYEIRVSENFEFHLVRQDGGVVAKSKGENLLLNLAFVSALIEMAYSRKNAQGDFLVQGTVAPFVIDAPFGELDETYRAATANFLPETAKQLVLLLSSSHWKGTVDKAISDRVGAEYVLVSSKRVERGDKPEDKLEIREKTFTQSVYSAERDATSLVEVL